MSTAKKVGSAALLLIFRKSWNTVLNLAVMMYLARKLDPTSFGLLAISSVFITIIGNLAVSGIGEYIVYYKEEDKKELVNAAFWLNSLLTISVCCFVVITIPYWSDFYGDERIVNLVYLLLVGFVAEMMSVIPVSIFRKSMDFKKMIFLQTFFNTLIGLGKVVFAFLNFGVYSLALPIAIFQPLLAISLIFASGFKPLMTLGVSYWKKMMNYTKHIIGGRVLTRVVNEGDNILVGKLLSLQELGYYTLAFQLSNIFTNTLLPVISSLSLPIFSVTDEKRMKDSYLKMIGLISAISIPLLLFLIIFSDKVILFFYGLRWADAIMPTQILCLFTIFRSISSPTSAIFNAVGKPQIGFYFALIFTPFFLLSIWIGSLWGLVGVCICVTFMRLSGSQVTLYISSRLLKFNVGEIYRLMMPFFISAILTAAICYFLMMGQSSIWMILISGLIFGILYLGFLRIVFTKALLELSTLVVAMMPKSKNVVERILFLKIA